MSEVVNAQGNFSTIGLEQKLAKSLDEIIKERKVIRAKTGPKAKVAAKSGANKEKVKKLLKKGSDKRQTAINKRRGLASPVQGNKNAKKSPNGTPQAAKKMKGSKQAKENVKNARNKKSTLIKPAQGEGGGARSKVKQGVNKASKAPSNPSKTPKPNKSPAKFQLPKGAKMKITVNLRDVQPASGSPFPTGNFSLGKTAQGNRNGLLKKSNKMKRPTSKAGQVVQGGTAKRMMNAADRAKGARASAVAARRGMETLVVNDAVLKKNNNKKKKALPGSKQQPKFRRVSMRK